jgi:hypothetical protein
VDAPTAIPSQHEVDASVSWSAAAATADVRCIISRGHRHIVHVIEHNSSHVFTDCNVRIPRHALKIGMHATLSVTVSVDHERASGRRAFVYR